MACGEFIVAVDVVFQCCLVAEALSGVRYIDCCCWRQRLRGACGKLIVVVGGRGIGGVRQYCC